MRAVPFPGGCLRKLRGVACVLATLLALPMAAGAEGKHGELATLELFSPMSLIGISGLLAQRARAAAERAGYQVTGPDQAAARLGHETMKKLAACDLRAECLAELAAPLGGGRLLAGSLDRDETHYIVKLVLVDLATHAAVASAEQQILIAARQLDTQFDTMLPDLLAGKSVAPTHLTLTSPQKHVHATVDDRPLGELPATIDLSPGRHEVKAEKPNYLPQDRWVDLAPGQTTTVDLPLTLMPNRFDPDEAQTAPTVHTAPSPAGAVAQAPETANTRVPTATWIASGVAVAAVGVGVVFGLKEKGIANRDVDANGDGVLDVTRADALSAKQDATIANVAFVAAGAAAVTAAVFYVLGGDDAAPADGKPKVSAAPIDRGGLASVTVGF